MDGLRKLLLVIKGRDMNSMTRVRLYYDQLLDQFLSEKGEAKFSGLAPVSSFKGINRNNAEVSYEVEIDTLRYPELKDYADKLKSAFDNVVKERTASYTISKTSGNPPMDVITFNLEYAYKLKDLDADIKAASSKVGQDAVELYKQAVKTKNDQLKKQLLTQYPDLANIYVEPDKPKQTVEVSPVRSAAEEDLKQKAIQPEEKQEVQAEGTKEKPAERQSPSQVTVNQPVIISPGEKLTISKEKQSTSDKSSIESIINSVFDKKISSYTNTLLKTQEGKPSPVESSPVVPTQPIYNTEKLRELSSTQKTTTSQGGFTVSKVMESVLGPNVVLVPVEIPQGQINASSVISDGKTTNTLGNTTEISQRSSSVAGDILSTVNNSVQQIQGSIGLLSNVLKEKERDVKSTANNVVNESLSFLGLIPSTERASTEKLNESVVQSERIASQNNVLQNMTSKVVGTESITPLKNELTSIVENLGTTIKSAITNVMLQDKKIADERSISNPPPVVKPSTSMSIVNEGQSTDTDVQSPNSIQNFMSSGGRSPAVVSLSQSTIDNLASAIIKNMSISPFLNSGR